MRGEEIEEPNHVITASVSRTLDKKLRLVLYKKAPEASARRNRRCCSDDRVVGPHSITSAASNWSGTIQKIEHDEQKSKRHKNW